MLGPMLLTEHNVRFYQRLMRGMRDAIAAGTFADHAGQTLADLARGDISPL
jgi:queuine tRNA-ribosyltransferase